MHPFIKPLREITRLNNPLLIAGFAGPSGATAASAVGYLVDQWDADPLADVDPDELYVFTGMRPLAVERDGQRTLEWPTNRFFVARPHGSDRDVVLLLGVEPHLRWAAFSDAVASLMHEVGAREALLLGAYPTATPHTRSLPVRLTAADVEFGRTFGIEPAPSRYQGPTDIRGALEVHLSKSRTTAAMSVLVPFYVGAEQHPRGMIALIEAIDRALGTRTPTAMLRRQAAMFDQHADEIVRNSEELQALLHSLEQQMDGAADDRPLALPETTPDLPSSIDLIADVEEFLREQPGGAGRTGGDGSSYPR